MTEVERIAISAAVECSVVDQTDDYARRQLTGERLLVAAIETIFQYLKTLTHDAFYRILGRGGFQILCVLKERRLRQFYFSHKQRSVRHDEFRVCSTHQAEVVVTSDQFYFHTHFVQ